MPKYTEEEFAKKLATLRRHRIIIVPLIPLSVVIAVLKAHNGDGWFPIVSFIVLAVLFTVSATYITPRRIEKLQAEQYPE